MNFSLTKLIVLATKTSIYVFVLSAVIFQFALAEISMGQEMSKVKIDLAIKNVELEELFNQIEAKTDFSFIYDITQLPKSSHASYFHENESVENILMAVAKKYELEFHQINKSISVKRVKKNGNKDPKAGTLGPEDLSISGYVYDEFSEPLPGATIKIVGLNIGTVTNVEGYFELTVPEGADKIAVSFIGFTTKRIILNGQTTFSVQLDLDVESLEEVVVIGYGQNTKKAVSTSVSSVSAKDLRDQPVISLDEAIASKMAGVQVSQTSGAPGSGFNINIRGTGTITAGSTPLYVVDGVPLSDRIQSAGGTLESYSDAPINPLNSININDIESISVLKDAAATAIYGSRGANGVVIVTTKQGRNGKPKVNFDTYVGFQSVNKKVDMMDAYEYAKLKYDGHNNTYLDFLADNNIQGSINDPNSIRGDNGAGSGDFKIPSEIIPYVNNVSGLTNTDWQDEIFRTGVIQSHSVSVSGGNGEIGYYLSGTYLKQTGVVISSGYEQYSARLNLNAEYGKFKFGVNFSPSRSIHDRVKAEGPYWADGVIGTALVSSPMFSVYNQDGSYNYGQQSWRAESGESWSDSYINPVALANLMINDIYHNRILGNAFMEYSPIKNLTFRTNIGIDVNDFTREYFRPKALPNRNLALDETPGEGKNRTEGLVNVVIEETANYNIKIGDRGDLSLLAGITGQKENQNENYISVRNFPNDLVTTLNAALTVDNAGSQRTSWALLSYIGRAQYNFGLKYFLSASIRADGASRFGADSRWGYFPSGSAAWVVSEESFFDNNFLTFLKVRGSYGETGNFNIGNFPWLTEFEQKNYVLGTGSGGQQVVGVAPATLGNENIRWEKTATIDIGAEIGFFEDLVTFEVDAYRSTTSDMLLTVPVPEITGFGSALQNIGEVKNRGLELTSNVNMKIGQVQWTVGGNVSFNRNEVMSLGTEDAPIIVRGGSEGALYITRIGNEIGSYYTYVRDGIFTSQEELDSYPHISGTRVGDAKVLDLNEDGQLDENDRAITGSYLPDYTFGINSRMSFKGVDLSVQVQGVQGNEVMNLQKRYIHNLEGHQNNLKSANIRYESPTNIGNGETPRAHKGLTGNAGLISTWMIEDGSFVRIRNITLGYSLQPKLLERINVSALRLYTSLQNPFTFTDYSGYNPEVSGNYNGGSALTRGEDYGTYPLARTITIGLNVGF